MWIQMSLQSLSLFSLRGSTISIFCVSVMILDATHNSKLVERFRQKSF